MVDERKKTLLFNNLFKKKYKKMTCVTKKDVYYGQHDNIYG